MNKKFRYLFVSLFVALVAFALTSCELFEQEWTWTFENSASGVSYIVVTPEDSEDDTPFTLYYGQTHDVTWKSASEDYRGAYKWTTYGGSSYVRQYDSLKEIVFYTQY